jgi:uncharacterized protein YkwD
MLRVACAYATPIPLSMVLRTFSSLQARGLSALLVLACLGAVAAPSQPDAAQAAARIVAEANRFRASHGVGSLANEARLTAAAESFAAYMARTDRYGHDADGGAPPQRASAQGYEWCVVLENIAWVQSSAGFTTSELATRLIDGWKQSPEHRRNLLDPTVVDTGVGLAPSARTGRWYAVQMFGRSHAAEIAFSVENPTEVPVRYHTARERFVLEPGMTRTHRLCIPQSVGFDGVSGATTIEPRGGEHWVVQADGSGGVRIARAVR